ncbi:hypothetical protein ASF91_18055 [Rhizobium sp. Leaf155]|nr:hypothetical protein ASF91_18055 [Rhizobium sp. Leaf155]
MFQILKRWIASTVAKHIKTVAEVQRRQTGQFIRLDYSPIIHLKHIAGHVCGVGTDWFPLLGKHAIICGLDDAHIIVKKNALALKFILKTHNIFRAVPTRPMLEERRMPQSIGRYRKAVNVWKRTQ